MIIDSDAFARSWEGHVKELIKISAKKANRVEQKHEQIVKGAIKVFLEKGFHPTTIREISEAAGMSMGQLYHYVSSKDDVLFLIHRHLQIAFSEHMNTYAIIDDDDDAVAAITKALRHCQTFMMENNKLFQFIYRESKYLSKKHLQVVLQMDDKNIIEYWRRLLEAVKKQKGLAIDINFSANLIAYLSVFIPMRGWNLKERPIKEQQALLVEHILKTIGVQGA